MTIPSLSDANQPDVLVPAAAWIEGALLGSIATTFATIAVAITGYLLLTGRVDVRRGTSVVLGCFILFGARAIAQGINGPAHGADDEVPALAMTPASSPLPPSLTAIPSTPPAQQSGYDPYAGAAVPIRSDGIEN